MIFDLIVPLSGWLFGIIALGFAYSCRRKKEKYCKDRVFYQNNTDNSTGYQFAQSDDIPFEINNEH